MVELKLARLPERTPVSITFKASPELDLALRQYAALYRAAYGKAEAVAELTLHAGGVPRQRSGICEGAKGRVGRGGRGNTAVPAWAPQG